MDFQNQLLWFHKYHNSDRRYNVIQGDRNIKLRQPDSAYKKLQNEWFYIKIGLQEQKLGIITISHHHMIIILQNLNVNNSITISLIFIRIERSDSVDSELSNKM